MDSEYSCGLNSRERENFPQERRKDHGGTLNIRVYVNDAPLEVLAAMTVKHALIQGDVLKEIACGKKVYDEWGNEIGLDGALSEGIKLYVR